MMYNAHNRSGILHECGACIETAKNAEHKAHFDALDALSLEERLRKVEEFIYAHGKTSHYRPMDRLF